MTDPQPLCGITHDFRGTEYPPCTRPAGHVEAYCHSTDGRHFLAHPDEPAAGTDVTALLADNQHLRQQLARAEAAIERVQAAIEPYGWEHAQVPAQRIRTALAEPAAARSAATQDGQP